MMAYNESTLLQTLVTILLFAFVPLECNLRKTVRSVDEKERKNAFNLTTPEKHPYAVLLVAMRSSRFSGVCSGSLLTSRWTLTAAHCFSDNNYFFSAENYIYAGGYSFEEVKSKKLANSSQLSKVDVIMKHSEYDLALAGVEQDFTLTKYVNTVLFTLQDLPKNQPVSCTLTGYGRLETQVADPFLDHRRKTQKLTAIHPCPCSSSIWQKLKEVKDLDRNHFICSVPREDYGICRGDSGSGLICGGVLVAVSTVIKSGMNLDTCARVWSDLPPCGRKNTLNIFLETWARARWINSITHVYPDDTVFSGGSSTLTLCHIWIMECTAITAFTLPQLMILNVVQL